MQLPQNVPAAIASNYWCKDLLGLTCFKWDSRDSEHITYIHESIWQAMDKSAFSDVWLEFSAKIMASINQSTEHVHGAHCWLLGATESGQGQWMPEVLPRIHLHLSFNLSLFGSSWYLSSGSRSSTQALGDQGLNKCFPISFTHNYLLATHMQPSTL